MKRGLILASLIMGILMLGLALAENCTETDGGENYGTKGVLTMVNSTNSSVSENMTDSCSDDNTLLEYFCEGNTVGTNEETCRYGCENGACVTIACSAEHLRLCWDKNPCINAGGFWYDSICHEETQEGEDQDNETEDNNTSQGLGQTIRRRVQAGIYTSPTGKQIQVSELAQNRIRFKVRELEAETELEIEEETENNQTRLRVKLKNGTLRELKIMPDTASETALARLRLIACTSQSNCTIELKDIGKKNISRIAYELQRQRTYRLYGLFKKIRPISILVDAETGEVIKVQKPWWAFLATEPEEDEE
jgi:hypothetical protein